MLFFVSIGFLLFILACFILKQNYELKKKKQTSKKRQQKNGKKVMRNNESWTVDHLIAP